MKKIISFTVFVLLLNFSAVLAQVTISPTNLFIGENARFGTFMVINGSNEAQEISIDFLFNYSKTNPDGSRFIVDDDSVSEDRYSIADHVRAFPRNFTLAPGQRQTIRLRLSPPNDLEDGTYWARIKTSASAESPPLELQSNDAVAARVGITLEQVTGLFYKKGNVTTGIEIDEIRTERSAEDQTLKVLTDVKRTGNSPFLGSITTTLLNADGREVASNFVSTSVYFDGTYTQDLDISGVSPGFYTVKVLFESQRSDIASTEIVQMQPVSKTVSYRLN